MSTPTDVQAPPHWSDEFRPRLSGESPTGTVKIHTFDHGDVTVQFDGQNEADVEVVQEMVRHAATLGMTTFALFSPQRQAEIDPATGETGESRVLRRNDPVPAEASEVQITQQLQGG